jgi:hypothetical protein
MVWLHGGGYDMGFGNDSLINAAQLPQHSVVLVNVNMRLNVLGLAEPFVPFLIRCRVPGAKQTFREF